MILGVVFAYIGLPVRNLFGKRRLFGSAVATICIAIPISMIVGIGAIVLDGAEVGKHSIVGGGSLVPPGMKIPDNSLVLGIPAKVVRVLNEEDRKRSEKQLAEAYEKSRKYLRIFGKR
jgi:carbonic anhydrase/acetyltransferase-like protein (isoleucine patch superfamily)